MPAGYRAADRRPFGITLIGPAHSDAALLSLAADYERHTSLRRSPREINPSLFSRC